jgi:hypothetical protein
MTRSGPEPSIFAVPHCASLSRCAAFARCEMSNETARFRQASQRCGKHLADCLEGGERLRQIATRTSRPTHTVSAFGANSGLHDAGDIGARRVRDRRKSKTTKLRKTNLIDNAHFNGTPGAPR